MYTKQHIKDDLLKLGICQGDSVLIHSSYKSLGEIQGGAMTFLETFMELLGENGTLVLPALSYETVTRDMPEFDINETPSCVGYLAEYFRTKFPGVRRSMHATHSCCAVGKLRDAFVDGHELDATPVGSNSPFAKLQKYNGKILMIGCRTVFNTSMHGVEETVKLPYGVDMENPVTYTLKDGEKTMHKVSYRHHFISKSGERIVQRYDRIADVLNAGEMKEGYLLDSMCYLIDAKAMWEKGHKKLLEDPWYFVDNPDFVK